MSTLPRSQIPPDCSARRTRSKIEHVVKWLRPLRREQYYLQKYQKNALSLLGKDSPAKLRSLMLALRSYPAWRRSFQSGASALHDRRPWITFEACKFLESVLTRQTLAFEFGCGGSTLFLAERVRHLISVEHDSAWFDLTRSALSDMRPNNTELVLIPPEPLFRSIQKDVKFDDPEAYAEEGYEGHNFCKYASYIDLFPDEYFDFVTVDGCARPSCVVRALSKVKVKGYLMLDDSERSTYQPVERLLSDWEKHEFYGPGPYSTKFWSTSIWRRKKESVF